jgi:hypothetical protein
MTQEHHSMTSSRRSHPIRWILAWAALAMALDLLHGRSASVTFEFRSAPGVVPDYDQVSVWLLADDACAYWEKGLKWQTREKSFRKTFGDLKPGDYYYLVFTGAYAERRLARPGAFSTSIRGLELTNAATQEAITIEYRPLTNFTAHHGDGHRTGRIVDLDGQPIAGRTVRLGLVCEERKGDGLYAFDTVTTGADGTFTFTNVHPAVGAEALDVDFDFLGRLEPKQPLVITDRKQSDRLFTGSSTSDGMPPGAGPAFHRDASDGATTGISSRPLRRYAAKSARSTVTTRLSRMSSVIRTMHASARSISRSAYFWSRARTPAVCSARLKASRMSPACTISTIAAGWPVIAAASARASGQE